MHNKTWWRTGGFAFLYIFIKSKNTSEQMKHFIFINIISTIFLIEVCTRHMDQIQEITRNHEIKWGVKPNLTRECQTLE